MARTTIFDIVKISDLVDIQVLTDLDYIVVNDHDPVADNYQSRKILIGNLAKSVGTRINLRDIADVGNVQPTVNQILRWDGSRWVPSDEDVAKGLTLQDFTAYNDPNPRGGGELGYNSARGIFTFYPADVYGPLHNHGNVSAQTPVDGDVLTYDANASTWYPSSIYKIQVIQKAPSGIGSLTANGNNLTYTPPDTANAIPNPSGSKNEDVLEYVESSNRWAPRENPKVTTPMIVGKVDAAGDTLAQMNRGGYTFTSSKNAVNEVDIVFNPPLPHDLPVVTVTAESQSGSHFCGIASLTRYKLTIFSRRYDTNVLDATDATTLNFSVTV